MYNSVKLTMFNKLKPICYFQHSRSHEVKKIELPHNLCQRVGRVQTSM